MYKQTELRPTLMFFIKKECKIGKEETLGHLSGSSNTIQIYRSLENYLITFSKKAKGGFMSLVKLRRAENRLPLYSLPVPLLDLRGHPQTVTRSRAARALPLCQGWAHPLSFRVGDRVSRVLLKDGHLVRVHGHNHPQYSPQRLHPAPRPEGARPHHRDRPHRLCHRDPVLHRGTPGNQAQHGMNLF